MDQGGEGKHRAVSVDHQYYYAACRNIYRKCSNVQPTRVYRWNASSVQTGTKGLCGKDASIPGKGYYYYYCTAAGTGGQATQRDGGRPRVCKRAFKKGASRDVCKKVTFDQLVLLKQHILREQNVARLPLSQRAPPPSTTGLCSMLTQKKTTSYFEGYSAPWLPAYSAILVTYLSISRATTQQEQ